VSTKEKPGLLKGSASDTTLQTNDDGVALNEKISYYQDMVEQQAKMIEALQISSKHLDLSRLHDTMV
jgi:hypothetical protein